MITVDAVLGQTTQKRTGYRPMALQYAITAVLTRETDMQPFPGVPVEIMAERFDALAAQIVDTANEPGWATSPGYRWTPAFTEAEAADSLRTRGYRPTISASAAPVILPPAIQPMPIMPVRVQIPAIQPAPIAPVRVQIPAIQPAPITPVRVQIPAMPFLPQLPASPSVVRVSVPAPVEVEKIGSEKAGSLWPLLALAFLVKAAF